MSTFIRTVGRVSLNGISFDLYENKNGSATVRPVSNGRDFPKSQWIRFDSIDAIAERIDAIAGEDVTGAARVKALKEAWLDL